MCIPALITGEGQGSNFDTNSSRHNDNFNNAQELFLFPGKIMPDTKMGRNSVKLHFVVPESIHTHTRQLVNILQEMRGSKVNVSTISSTGISKGVEGVSGVGGGRRKPLVKDYRS